MAKTKHRCRLYLQIPVPLTAKLDAQLSQALTEVAPACVLICDNGTPLETSSADALIDRIQEAGAACLLENGIEAAADLGTDGVQIDADPGLYGRAREALGESANIGVSCGLRRHEAMLLAEAGADYVAFGDSSAGPRDFKALSELIAWWSEIFVVPSVAFNVADVTEAEQLTQLGVDFIAPPQSIWDSDAAIETLRTMDRAIGRIRRAA